MKRITIIVCSFVGALLMLLVSIGNYNRHPKCERCGGAVQVLYRDVDTTYYCQSEKGFCQHIKESKGVNPLAFSLLDSGIYYLEALCDK